MDSRVPITFGLEKEPPRYRTRFEPDGSLHRTEVEDAEWMWDKGLFPRAAIRKRAFYEKKPSKEVLDRGAEARRRTNARIRANKLKVKF